jgi:hypothetical protein
MKGLALRGADLFYSFFGYVLNELFQRRPSVARELPVVLTISEISAEG